MSFSRDQQAQILNDIRGESLKLHLYSTNPTSVDGGVEISNGSYVPVAITFAAPVVVGLGTEITNDIVVTFPTATADWSAPITHFGVRVDGGRLVSYGTLTESGLDSQRVVRTGDIFRVTIGNVRIRLDD